MKFEIPKRNLREEKDSRVSDPEQAHVMALVENSKRSEAEAYAGYLEHPEAYVGSEHNNFRAMEEDGLKPEDLVSIGQEWSEKFGEAYVFSHQVEKLKQEGKKWELLKLAAKHGFKSFGHMLVGSAVMVKEGVKFLFSSERREQIIREFLHDTGLQKADPQQMREWGIKKRKPQAIIDDMVMNSVKLLDASMALFSKEDGIGKDDNWNGMSERLREQANSYYKPEKEKKAEEWGKEDSTIGADFVDYVFNAEADFYEDFLGGQNFFGGSIKDHFETLKEKGIDPEEIRKDGKYWKKIMADLKTWNERLKKVDDAQLEKEIKENMYRFNNILFGFKKYKKGEENQYMRDYIVSMYKYFKTCYVQARRKSAEKVGAKEFAFGEV